MPSPLDPRQYESLAKLRLTLTSKDLGAATLGNQLIIDLPLPEPLPAATVTAPAAAGTAPAKVPPGATNAKAAAGAAAATPAAGLTRDYAVRAYGPQGDRSALSNQALLMPKEPPQPPEAVTVTPQADGILVAWKPVANGGGYAVYRRAATERFSSKPLALVRSGETRHLDQTARFGQSYIYSVTTVDPRQPLVESAIKAEQEIRYVDVYPPPVPEELVAVAEAGRARLVWRQSEAPDLAGYIVYRRGSTGDYARLTAKPIAATNYVDTAVVSGQAYDYRVTAIDQTGNESAPSAEVHVAVP
jgi:fibronectin type 3 domain-containing protein